MVPPLVLPAGPMPSSSGLIALRHVNESDGRLRGRLRHRRDGAWRRHLTLAGVIAFLSMGFLYLRENANHAASQNNLRQMGFA
jgi:hypothetical protein